MKRAAVLLPLLLLPAAAAAQEREALPGWGPFRFGMTLDEAQAVAGITARRYLLALELDVDVNGEGFTAVVTALGESGKYVTGIELHKSAARETKDPNVCLAYFEPLLAAVVAKYGQPDSMPVSEKAGTQIKRSAGFKFKDGAEIKVVTRYLSDPKMLPTAKRCYAFVDYLPGKLPRERPKGKF